MHPVVDGRHVGRDQGDGHRRVPCAVGADGTAGQVDTVAEPSYDAAIDTSGKVAAMDLGFQQLRRGGTLVMVGTGLERPSFDPNRMIVMELTVRGSFVYDADGFERALEMLGDPAFPSDAMIDDAEYGLDGIAEAAGALAAGRHAGKVMIRPGMEIR